MLISITATTAIITCMLFLCPKACGWWWEPKDEQSTENTARALPGSQLGGDHMLKKPE